LLLLLDATATLPGNKCALFASAQYDATKEAQGAAMAFKLCHSTKSPTNQHNKQNTPNTQSVCKNSQVRRYV
jgi:hypothetical protein